jgi:transposase-like protein
MLKFKNLFELLKSYPTEQDCIRYYEEIVWNGKPVSPFDPTSKVYQCSNNQYKCKNTNKYFNIKTRTVFENSKISLLKWFQALYFLTSYKKGITSLQLAEEISVTQKTAWFVLHRLRKAFEHPNFVQEMLGNEVEIDETFIGGKNKNRHWNKKVPHSQGRSWKDKVPVLGMLERNGNLIAQVVPNTSQNTLEPMIKASIKKGASIYTDEWYAYQDLSKNFNHQIVNHRIKQYVNGRASTNAIENRWSHLKRIIGITYNWTKKKHLQKYVNEFTFRSNTRKCSKKERFDLALSSSLGKRLTYQELVNCQPFQVCSPLLQ